MTTTSRFSTLEKIPETEPMVVLRRYQSDQREEKVLLARRFFSVGGDLTPTTPDFVREAYRSAAEAVAEGRVDLGYLPRLGSGDFVDACARLILGDSRSLSDGLVLGVQTAGGGTGALRLGMEFLVRQLGYSDYYCSEQTWDTHYDIFSGAGLQQSLPYRYLDRSSYELDLEGMLEDLRAAPEDSLVVLHTSAHNPTGMDPTEDQWRKIADVFAERKLLPFFDCAFIVKKQTYHISFFFFFGKLTYSQQSRVSPPGASRRIPSPSACSTRWGSSSSRPSASPRTWG